MPSDTVITPEDSTNNDCPLLTKTRVVLGNKGVCATVEWQIRDKNGNPVDLSEWLCQDADSSGELDSSATEEPPYPDCGQVLFRFADAAWPGPIWQSVGWSTDTEQGIVRGVFPTEVAQNAGIYIMEIAISKNLGDGEYQLVLIDKGLLSMERGLFGSLDYFSDLQGPPTLQEIRIALRDTMMENELLDDVEFDDAEIINALARPLRQWNETPPPIAYFDSRSFPFHENWLKATVSLLMKSAAYWYERNNLSASHGGVSVNDRNKMQPYMIMAQSLYEEWTRFIISKKVSINVANCYGAVSSPYTGY